MTVPAASTTFLESAWILPATLLNSSMLVRGDSYLKIHDIVASPSDTRGKVRNASSNKQPSHSDKTIAASSDRDIEGVKILVDLKPRRASSDAENRTVRAQDRRVQTRHVDRDTAVDVRKAGGGRMSLTLDGKLATVDRGDDGNGPRHILCCQGMQNASRLQPRFLQRPVRVLGGIVGWLVEKADFGAELLGQPRTLGAGPVSLRSEHIDHGFKQFRTHVATPVAQTVEAQPNAAQVDFMAEEFL